MTGNGRRPDVAGNAEQAALATRSDVDQQRCCAVVMNDRCHIEICLAQNRLDARQQRRITDEARQFEP